MSVCLSFCMCVSLPPAMITRLLWKATCLLAVVLTATSRLCWADSESPATEKGVTFSHVYKIDMQPGSCDQSQPQDTGLCGENNMETRDLYDYEIGIWWMPLFNHEGVYPEHGWSQWESNP